MGSAMKLYAWQPTGHGPLSFFVVAESESAARKAISDHLDAKGAAYERSNAAGWREGGNGYALTIAEPGQVVENDNE
jgi:hypothetical protein